MLDLPETRNGTVDAYTSGWSQSGWEPRDPFDPEVDDTVPGDEDEDEDDEEEEEEEWGGLQRDEDDEGEEAEETENEEQSQMHTRSGKSCHWTAIHLKTEYSSYDCGVHVHAERAAACV